MAKRAYIESSVDSPATVTGSINGVNKDFVLTRTPDSGSVIAFINNTVTSSSVSTATVTLASAPESGDSVYFHYTVAITSADSSDSINTVTAQTIIESAMRKINKLGAGQTIATADLALGLAELNDMIDYWRTRRVFISYISDDSYTLTSSKQAYTIGQESADFTADRPIKLTRANLIIVSNSDETRKELKIIEWPEYADVTVPAEYGAEPTHLYYQPTIPNGTLWPWPYPENTTTALINKLELFTWCHLYQFTSASSAVYLAPGYENALKASLAERLSIPFGVAVSIDLRNQARLARAAIASNNTQAPKMQTRDYGIPTAESW